MTSNPTDQPTGTTTEVCGCGQDLDVSHRAHCPRCGTHLKSVA